MSERYAIYYAPEQGSSLERLGTSFIGRCAETGDPVEQPSLSFPLSGELKELTRSPRFYGFHGTLVPPFPLKASVPRWEFMAFVHECARDWQPFSLGSLSIQVIGNFIALVPKDPVAVSKLAEACLRALHPFREQPSLAELERRRAKGLTANQERLLANWGYPYVLDEFRFHLTLTDSIRDGRLRYALVQYLTDFMRPVVRQEQWVREVCVFYQQDSQSPFTLIKRIPLGAQQESL